jgi:hypothetical protein
MIPSLAGASKAILIPQCLARLLDKPGSTEKFPNHGISLGENDLVRQIERVKFDALLVIATKAGAIDAEARHAQPLAVGNRRKWAGVLFVRHRSQTTTTGA